MDPGIESLISSTNDSIPLYTLDGVMCKGKVVSIYDGDTCTCNLLVSGNIIKHKIRLLGFDSPEIRPKLSVENRDEIIKNAKIARNYLASLVSDQEINLERGYSKKEFQSLLDCNKKIIDVECGTWDKYGRLLATFTTDNDGQQLCVNEVMVEKGYGYAYDGGTKKK